MSTPTERLEDLVQEHLTEDQEEAAPRAVVAALASTGNGHLSRDRVGQARPRRHAAARNRLSSTLSMVRVPPCRVRSGRRRYIQVGAAASRAAAKRAASPSPRFGPSTAAGRSPRVCIGAFRLVEPRSAGPIAAG